MEDLRIMPASQPGSVDRSAPAEARRVGVGVRLLALLFLSIAILLIWTVAAGSLSAAVLPEPAAVGQRFVQAVGDGTYLPALLTTAWEAAVGWALGAAVALPLGYVLGRVRALEDVLAPYLAGSQAMPIVAIAPLLVVWVGFGLLPKVIVCALIAFFPMLATTASGVRGVPTELRDAARVFGAGVWALAIHIDLPLALRSVFAGVKVGAALSVTGAVVGEFVAADQGLGFLVMFGRENGDTPLMFVALLSLMALGALAYGLAATTERLVMRWDE